MIGLTDDLALRDLSNGVVYSYMSDVQGDIAEFGCFWGKSSQAIAAAMQGCENVHPKERRLWLFDSFQGLPAATLPPDLESPHVQSKAWTWTVEGDKAPTPLMITQACSAYLPVDRIKVIPGWYKDTLASIPADTKFALVHIDCDLYESAYQVLDHLFGNDMLSDGCALFFDDWYCNRGNPAFGEQKALADCIGKYYHRKGTVLTNRTITDWGSYGIVGRKFIVHR